jgi:hypothetical protein
LTEVETATKGDSMINKQDRERREALEAIVEAHFMKDGPTGKASIDRFRNVPRLSKMGGSATKRTPGSSQSPERQYHGLFLVARRAI